MNTQVLRKHTSRQENENSRAPRFACRNSRRGTWRGIARDPENLNVLVHPIGNVTVEYAVGLQFDLEFVAYELLAFFHDLRHALESDGRFAGSEEPDGRLGRPREEFLHTRDREIEIDGAIARFNCVAPMWNVAVGAIQVARARHEKADAVFSIVAHLAKKCCMRETKGGASGARERNVVSTNGL